MQLIKLIISLHYSDCVQRPEIICAYDQVHVFL